MRRCVRVACAAVVLFVLAGCVRLDMDLTVGLDENLDGAIVVAFDKKAIGPFVSSEDLLQQVEKQNPLGRRPAHGSVTIEDYDADGMVGKRYRYTGVPLADFSAGGALRLRHEGRRYLLDGELDLTSRGDSRVNIGALTDTASASVRLTFPGTVLASNGEIVGHSVTWRPEFGKKTPLTAEADDGRPVPSPVAAATGAGGPVPWLPVAVAGGLLVLFALLGGWLLVRRRSRRVAGPAAWAAPVAGPAGWPVPDPAGGTAVPRHPTLPLPVLESPSSLVRDPRWSEQGSSGSEQGANPWRSGQRPAPEQPEL